MHSKPVKKVVIAGGGTAGWLAAAALSHQLGKVLDITLIESDEIGTIGVGEATIPPIRVFHKLLQIDEQEFMRATAATFKLGISFENWGLKGDNYIHSFGRNGKPTWMCEFHNFWLRSLELGVQSELGDYCFELQAAKAGKFGISQQIDVNFAYHFDASQYAKFLRKFAEGFGIKRVEGKIKEVKQNAATGFIESLVLHSGATIEGDLFIDCTGFRGLIIEQTLKSGYEDWSHWLPCDSAAAVQTELTGLAPPLTRSIAHDAGWRWCIPLQHRVGNGLVYSSAHMSDERARQLLDEKLEGDVLVEPRLIRFKAGRRPKVWVKNCIAFGLSSGFIEPLESTSIHLIMIAIIRLLQVFPSSGISSAVAERFNEQANREIEGIRDFIVLHYHLNQREGSDFWRDCRNLDIPDSLKQRIAFFRDAAHVYQDTHDLFRIDSWVQVMLGQRLQPSSYHPATRLMPEPQLKDALASLKGNISNAAASLPFHEDALRAFAGRAS